MALQETLRIAEAFPNRVSRRLNRLTRRTRWLLYGLGIVLLLAIAWPYIAGLVAPQKKSPPPPPVKVTIVQRRDVSVMAETIGTVVSPAMVQVTAQVTGKLLAANFQEGDIVHKGDVLFQIDPAPYQAALAQAEGQLARDTATLANDRVRSVALPDPGAAECHLQPAARDPGRESQVRRRRRRRRPGQCAELRASISTTPAIVSPIDGKTGPIFIQPGNVIPAVSANAQPLVTITQIQPIKVSFMLPQNSLSQIQNQQPAAS